MSHSFPSRGFTLVELLIAVAIIAMLAILTMRGFARDRDLLRDRTLAANLDAIQTAIERYHTDHDQYPLFLLGGDVEGWRLWHATYDEAAPDPTHPQNAWLHDPLIEGGYLASYPENPFVDDGGKAMRLQTSRPGQPMGDPRFGLDGDLVGNGLDDPKLFRNLHDYEWLPRIELFRTQLTLSTIPSRIMPYAMGGRRGPALNEESGTPQRVATWWPGNFGYRSVQDVPHLRKGWTIYWPHNWYEAHYAPASAYLLVSYGRFETSGEDVIRLETHDPTGQQLYYHSTWIDKELARLSDKPRMIDNLSVPASLPEVFGGGSAWRGPATPYNPFSHPGVTGERELLFGSPDGIPDGVIAVVTGGEVLGNAY